MSIAEKLTTIAENEPKVFEAGHHQGYNKGYENGEARGLIDGNAQGRQAQYDEFWDSFQSNGNRPTYAYAFARWTMDIFNPKYDVKPVGSIALLFAYSSLTNIAQRLEDCGVTLDTSEVTAFGEFASYTGTITRLPVISTVSASALNAIFYNCSVRIVDKLILKDDGSQTFSLTSFSLMPNLTNIVIEGKFGVNISFSASKNLTYESLVSIINALKDYSGTTNDGVYTLYLSSTSKDLLLAQGNVSPNGNTWINYVYDKGWNV